MNESLHHTPQTEARFSKILNKKLLTVGAGLTLGALIIGTLVVGAWENPSASFAAVEQTMTKPQPNVSQPSMAQGFAEIVKAVRPAVVNITVANILTNQDLHNPFRPNPFGLPRDFDGHNFFPWPEFPQGPQPPHQRGMGSGVIVSPDGYVVTNHHVVVGANEVTVTLPDKREFSGKVIGADPQTDLAVVKIDGEDLPFIPWGNSSTLQVGDYVLAVGNPFGLSSTVTQGIVSALGRGGMGITQYEDFIQTDAAINPGNSGGALVNMHGELVGINTAIVSRTGGYQGVGFAIPSSMGKPVYDSLVKSGTVTRGYLGVGIQEMTPDLASALDLSDPQGVLVTDVKEGSPAEKAGLKRGDAIIQFHGNHVADPRALQRAVVRTPIGTDVTIKVIRDGQEHELSTMIGDHPDNRQVAHFSDSSPNTKLAGIEVKNLDSRLAQRLRIPDDATGVVVTSVNPGSPAEHAGLNQGDVIREINRTPVQSVNEYDQILSTLKKEDKALLFIHRRGNPLFLAVTV